MEQDNEKITLSVLQANSLRGLIDQVNANNHDKNEKKILKDDIVDIINIHDNFFLLYYK